MTRRRRGLSLAILPLLLLTVAGGAIGAGPAAVPPRRGYNEALAALEKGDLDAAEKGFLDARDRAGPDPELRFRAAFNLGLAYARKADAAVQGKPDEAIDGLRKSAAWFQDAIRLRPHDLDARVNLEVVLRRLQRLADELNRGKDGLEARLDRLIEDQRGLLGQVRGLVGRVAVAQAQADPSAFREEFRDAATLERTLLADASLVAELAGQEIAQLDARTQPPASPGGATVQPPSAEQAKQEEQDRARRFQLESMGEHLERARQLMTDAGRRLRALEGDRAHAEVDEALALLKRAREQLSDPVSILKGLAQDELLVSTQTAVLDAFRRGALRLAAPGPATAPAAGGTATPPADEKAAPPPWLTAAYLADQQRALRERTGELLARLRAGTSEQAGATAAPESPPPPGADPEAARREQLLAAARAAVPLLERADAAMDASALALAGEDLPRAAEHQREASEALASAIERFAAIRDLIELAWADQRQVAALLSAPAGAGGKRPTAGSASAPSDADVLAAIPPAERARFVAGAVARNHERLARLEALFRDEAAALDAQIAQAQGQPQPAPGGGTGQPSADELAKQRELYRLAEQERKAAADALDRLAQGLAKRQAAAGLAPSARETLDRIEALRRLFYSLVEHLKELARRQAEAHDRTASAQALADETERRQAAAPLADLETRHAGVADQLAGALREQADKAQQAVQARPAQPAPAPGGTPGGGAPDAGAAQAAEAARVLSEAAGEVTTAASLMREASSALTDATGNAQAAPMSIDLAPAVDKEQQALEHIEKAIQLLEPPQDQQQDEQQQQQQQQQQMSRDQAARQLQSVRDREAERLRKQRQLPPPEPVAKDW